jgi:hypothetical protein
VTSPVATQRCSLDGTVWVTDEHGALVVWWLLGENRRNCERHQRQFFHADCRWVSRDRKWRSKVDRQSSRVWVIAVPERTAKGEMKEQTKQAQAVSRLATGWTFRGSNTGRSKRVYFLKKRSDRVWSPSSVLFDGYQSVFPRG